MGQCGVVEVQSFEERMQYYLRINDIDICVFIDNVNCQYIYSLKLSESMMT